MVQLSHPYMTTGKTIDLTRWIFVAKVISLLFNMLSRLVRVFLPRSKHLLISWLQSPSAVILEPKKIKPLTVSIVYPSICHGLMGPDAMILVFFNVSYLFAFSYCSWGSQGKNTEVVCHSLLQWITFCQNSPPWPIHLGRNGS